MRSIGAGLLFFLLGCKAVPSALAEPLGPAHPPKADAPEAVSTPVAPAQEGVTLNLEACIRRAIATAPALEAAEFEVDSARAKLTQAGRSYFLPDIKLRVLGGPVPDVPEGSGPEAGFPRVETDLAELGPFLKARVEAVQPLYTFGKLSNLKKAARAGVKGKTAQEFAVRADVVHKVKILYNNLLYIYSLADFLKELQERMEKVRSRLEGQIQKRSPNVTEVDLMRLDVFRSETERRSVEAENGIRQGLRTMGILAGVPSHQAVEIADRELRFEEAEIRPVEYYLSAAQEARPELKALREAVTAKKSLFEAVKADYFPNLFLAGYYEYSKAPGRQDVNNPFLNDEFNSSRGGVALGLQQQLGFHVTNARVEEARADYFKTRADLARALQGVEIEIRNAHTQTIVGRDSVGAARNGLRAARSWVTALTLSFGMGVVPTKDVLEAFVAYSKVKASFFETVNDYGKALADLTKAAGEEVTALKY